MESRQALIEEISRQLKLWNDEIETYKKSFVQMYGFSMDNAQEELWVLKRYRDKLQNQLYLLRHSNASTWRELKTGLEKNMEDLKAVLNTARSSFL